MTDYVVGFAFGVDNSLRRTNQVLLVRKTHPDWQAGKLNGLGGKMDPGEKPVVTMSREFKEESGVVVWPDEWNLIVTLHSNGHTIHFFAAEIRQRILDALDKQQTDTDEIMETWDLHDLAAHQDKIPNLSWLVPLAAFEHDHYKPVIFDEIEHPMNGAGLTGGY